LVSLGDRTGALVAYQQLVERLDRELGTTPASATRALAERARLRVSNPVPSGPPHSPAPVIAHPAGVPETTAVAQPPTRALPRVLLGVPAVVALVAILRWRATPGNTSPLLAVGEIETLGRPDTLLPNSALANLLATSVARLPKSRVLSAERVR